jgi:hypothetical protein
LQSKSENARSIAQHQTLHDKKPAETQICLLPSVKTY